MSSQELEGYEKEFVLNLDIDTHKNIFELFNIKET